MKSRHYGLSMGMILGEDDGLPQLVLVLHIYAVGH